MTGGEVGGKAARVKATNSSPTTYLRTPHDGPCHATPRADGLEGHQAPEDEASTDAPDSDADSLFSDSSDSTPAIPSSLRGPYHILADTKATLKLMIDTWEPILGRYRGSGAADEAPPTWNDFK